MTVLQIPRLSLVLLVGATGSGKSTFARRVFAPSQVLSSDSFRSMVADDENDQSATSEAFDALNFVAGKRLSAGRLTVVDATNVQPHARAALVTLARAHDVLPVAVVLDLDQRTLLDRTTARTDRELPEKVVRRQHDQLRRGMKGLDREGFRVIHRLRTAEEVATATVQLTPMMTDFTDHTGPFDIIGDVHGCLTELTELLDLLGYRISRDEHGRPDGAVPPAGRTAVFVGDLVDRGPDSPGVLRLVMGMASAGQAMVVPGNHEDKLVRALRGRKVTVSHGLEHTLAQLADQTEQFRRQVADFCYGLVSHRILDGGRLVVAHAGMKQAYQGRASARVRAFALYGQTTGETDEFGLPVRHPWAAEYRGEATVVYGHTPTTQPQWVNNTICIDTGCCFGGRLTALRYPERELVSVAAARQYYEPARPLEPVVPPRDPHQLELSDVAGRRVVETRDFGRVTIGEESAAGALEVMSRFAVDPRWLCYLPPTMAPASAAADGPLLERPEQAFADFRAAGVTEVMCQVKHMGSRAVVVLRRADSPWAAELGGPGIAYSRTGRALFAPADNDSWVGRLRESAERAGLFDELDTDVLVLDGELLPWTAKAESLVRDHYAAVGAAGRAGARAERTVVDTALARLGTGTGTDETTPLAEVADRLELSARNLDTFTAAYRQHSPLVEGVAQVRFAPFTVLAGGSTVHATRELGWQLEIIDRWQRAAPELITATDRRVVSLDDAAAQADACRWWAQLCAAGAEGIVVKPAGGTVSGSRGLVQPGLKVRGPEYLTLIYGPDYRSPDRLAGLRSRSLGHKRSLALREYALGLEGLHRAVAGEPLWRIHECVFAVLALESEPVDPRL